MDAIKKSLLYSGKAKSLYETDQKDILWAEFRDDTSAFDGVKTQQFGNKGKVNNYISAHIMTALESKGIATHFQGLVSDTECLVKRLAMIPVECVIRNVATGSLCRRLGVQNGLKLHPPLYELFLKNDELHDPLINEDHAISFGWASQESLDQMRDLTFKINDVMRDLFSDAGLILVDAKFEFGISDGKIYVGDEISPDSCRIWDALTQEPLDKDVFRKDLGDVVEAYFQVADRLGITQTLE